MYTSAPLDERINQGCTCIGPLGGITCHEAMQDLTADVGTYNWLHIQPPDGCSEHRCIYLLSCLPGRLCGISLLLQMWSWYQQLWQTSILPYTCTTLKSNPCSDRAFEGVQACLQAQGPQQGAFQFPQQQGGRAMGWGHTCSTAPPSPPAGQLC